MIPRGTPDIDWADLAAGLAACFWARDRARWQQRAEVVWGAPRKTLVCLSVRSGFDLYLQAAAWPAGSEVLISAATIPDMLGLIRHHQLVPVPLDVCSHTLSIDAGEIAERITARTKAVVVAHLFGSRANLDALVAIAQRRRLVIIEDCAQAYDGLYRGHPQSDVRMFSFGPIKTATALGGAVLQVENSPLLGRMRQLQAGYPCQKRSRLMRRILTTAALKCIARPSLFGLFASLCRSAGKDHDVVVRNAMRGFPGQDLVGQIRRGPSAPLLYLLERRLSQAISDRIMRRVALAEKLFFDLKCSDRPGRSLVAHSHWVLPINSRDPNGLVHFLWRRGFDATRNSSSLEAVSPPLDRQGTAPLRAREMLSRLVYLPVYGKQSDRDLEQLARSIREFETGELEAADFETEEFETSEPVGRARP